MNNVVLLGRLGKDIELKTSKNDKSFGVFSIATNDGYGDNKKTNWHNCIAFGKTAEILNQYTSKGDEVCINGSVEYSKRDDKIFTNIVVNSFSFVSGAKKEENKKVETNKTTFTNQDDNDGLPF